MLGLVLRDFLIRRRRSSAAPGNARQAPATVAVVVQTVLRESLTKSIKSVYGQDLLGQIHLLVGVDKRLGDSRLLSRLVSEAPSNVFVTVFDPGYSTSARHGGPHTNHFGGSLRTLLSFAANSRYVAYLDDDDWYSPDHLSSLLAAIQGRQWAYSLRTFVNPFNLEPMCVDTIENVGPNAGVYASWGGFACPSSLLIDKHACARILHLWAEAGTPRGDAEDRVFFKALCEHFKAFGSSSRATVNCVVKPEDGNHSIREKLIIESGYPIERLRRSGPHGFERT